jgi:glycosyltransferase involved in cell wall biosynthesis
MQSKADLHVHSKFSNRPSEWLLRRIGAPECFAEPEAIYSQATAQGMDFVTIADHNTIAGALEIAHHPNTFLSAELTTYFPEDRCKVHVLVHGMDEAQFAVMNEARESIYDLQSYLHREGLVYTVAHPLFSVNDRLTLDHFEKLLLLFPRFEVLNGTRRQEAVCLVQAVLDSLTPEDIRAMADKHGIAPVPGYAWCKFRTGGSDDHSGVYTASAHTVTPKAQSVTEFLGFLASGQHEAGGCPGTSLKLAHGFYHIAYSYYRDRFLDNGKGSMLLNGLLRRMAQGVKPQTEAEPPSLLRRVAQRVIAPWKRRRLSPVERTLIDEFSALFSKGPRERGKLPLTGDHATFELAGRICHQVGFQFLDRFLDNLRDMSFLESLQTLASLAPVALSIAPYIAAFGTQHKDEALLDEVRDRFGLRDHPVAGRKTRKAWVTDTFSDVNGVARTIRTLGAIARRTGRDLTVVTCLREAPDEPDLKIHNFPPVGMFAVPEYSEQKLAFPPFLDILEYFENERFTEVVISTPGPLGLTALAAARLLGLRVSGIYHTDFPKYVEILTDDEYMAQVTWRFMCWFYGQMDMIFAPSEWYRQHLMENGLARKRIEVMPRGVDGTDFSPAKRDAKHLAKYGCNGHFKFLYVGRISREKNVEHLLQSFDRLRERGHEAELILVGDGPLMGDLRRSHGKRNDVFFTGFLYGEELARTYAAADSFVFPSTTDTFGNVVLEAQASGLPAIVSTQGGPPEIVRRHESGIVVNMAAPDELTNAMERLCTDTGMRGAFRERALQNARERTWNRIFEDFWHNHPQPPAKV